MNNPTQDTDRIRSEPFVPAPSWSGPLFGMAILLAATTAGGLYLASRMNQEAPAAPSPLRVNNEPETVRANADVSILESMSPSDEPTFIQADLDSTRLESIDADLQAIDAELGEFEARIDAL
jgi:hypothetical protein